MITGWKASDATAAAAWSQQYNTSASSTATDNTKPTDSTTTSKPAENPEWEKARQALAKVTGASPQKSATKQQSSTQNSTNNNVMNTAMLGYGQYYQPYPNAAFPGFPCAPYPSFGYPPAYPFPQPTAGMPYPMQFPGIQPPYQGPVPTSNETTESDSLSTPSQPTNNEQKDSSNNRQTNDSSNQPPPNVYNTRFQAHNKGRRDQPPFNSRMNKEDQENNQAFDNDNRQFNNSNNQQQNAGGSYADAVKGGPKKTFWKQPQRSLPRPWAEGNTENHQFQTKRFKPAFESPSMDGQDNQEEPASYNETSSVTYNSAKPQSPYRKRQENQAPQQQSPPGNELSADKWPPSLRDYVQRCFKPCETEAEKDEIESALKAKLTKVFEDNAVLLIDWDEEPLPRLKNRIHSESSDNCPLDRWHPSRRRQSPPTRSPSMRHSSPPPWRKRGHSRSRSRSRSRSPSPIRSDVRERLGPKNTQKNGPKQKLKVPKTGKGKKGKAGPVLDPMQIIDPENQQKINKRAQRFQSFTENTNRSSPSILSTLNASLFADRDEEELDWSKFHVVGTCQDLKKNYYRLTAAPDPSTVRPKEVLIKSLSMIKDHWKANQDDYRYVCAQFKSIRQDLTVQGIRDEFTVEVYETHARIALEKGDREEFNQCQTQLKALYSNNISGNVIEFTSYRLLYHLLTNNILDYSTDLLRLTEEEKHTVPIKHAQCLCTAWALSNYHNFFQLYLCAPNMSGYLIDLFVQRERVAAIKAMIKSYRPTLPLAFIQSELGFTDQEECKKFLMEVGATMTADGSKVDCRVSLDVLNT
ncbi:leukocyte receptor cluster member 8 homolog [Actinia tenebrosa]|uniref:Leukocyte receptor cluster member 8 homolog n=1 Tax=Actinia tenebrosa TaxID=6105 RepID=A0A6P8HFL8_ACTTE|nr:leukocyte receptor cluster member 8 homolog [Actinia tenebrosa]